MSGLRSATFWAVLAACVSAGALVAIWQTNAGWPGTPNGCRVEQRPACFCEHLRDGAVAQPANTFSNLGFIAVGVLVGLHADRRRRKELSSPMTQSPVVPAVFAGVIALLGPGSMALHASMTIWGGRIDVLSMYLFIGLVVAWALCRLFELSGAAFAGLYVAIVAALAWTKWNLPINSDFVFGAMVALAIVLNVIVIRRRPEIRLDHRLVFLAAGLFALAFAVWLPSRSGGALCVPDSLLQGHALWHLLCAGAAGSVYLYLDSERPAWPAA